MSVFEAPQVRVYGATPVPACSTPAMKVSPYHEAGRLLSPIRKPRRARPGARVARSWAASRV